MIPREERIDLNMPCKRILINAGTFFFCQACFDTMPIKYRSKNKKYCMDCHESMTSDDYRVDDLAPASISQAQDIDEEAVKLSDPIETTSFDGSTPVNFTRKSRTLRKELPEDEILASTETSRILANRYGVSHTTIANIRRGQRVLV